MDGDIFDPDGAREKLADRSQEIIAETVGTETPAARAIAESVENRLRSEPGQDPPDADPGSEDDYENRSFLEKG